MGVNIVLEKNVRMNIWYQKCLEYYDSVPEYRDKIDLSNFTEKTACDAIKRAGMLCEEKQFSKDPDYVAILKLLVAEIGIISVSGSTSFHFSTNSINFS